MGDLRNYELNGWMVHVGLTILRQTLLRSHSEDYRVYTCHWRSRSILPLLVNPKQAWWFCLPHTSWYLCTCKSIVFWVSLDTMSRIFRCSPPHSYTIAPWAEPGPTVSSPTFCCPLHRALRIAWRWDPDTPKSVFLGLVSEWPFLFPVHFPEFPWPHTTRSWTLINFWVWGFFGIFLDLAVSLMGRAQAKGEKNSFLFLSWKFMPLYRLLILRGSLPDCETLSWIS